MQHFHPREHQIKQSHLADEPVHDIMLRGFVFFKPDSFPHGLKSPQRSEGIIEQPSLVAVVVFVVVVEIVRVAFLLVGAENKSKYIAPRFYGLFPEYVVLGYSLMRESKGEWHYMRHSALFKGVRNLQIY